MRREQAARGADRQDRRRDPGVARHLEIVAVRLGVRARDEGADETPLRPHLGGEPMRDVLGRERSRTESRGAAVRASSRPRTPTGRPGTRRARPSFRRARPSRAPAPGKRGEGRPGRRPATAAAATPIGRTARLRKRRIEEHGASGEDRGERRQVLVHDQPRREDDERAACEDPRRPRPARSRGPRARRRMRARA